MTKHHSTLMSNPDYREAFFNYFQTVGRNKRYAQVFRKKMEKIEKDFVSSKS